LNNNNKNNIESSQNDWTNLIGKDFLFVFGSIFLVATKDKAIKEEE
jgi:hypothetical protein